MSDYQVEIVEHPRDVDNGVISDGLNGFNRDFVGQDNYLPISIFVRDEKWQVIGGAICNTYWNVFSINLLWLPDAARHQGLGSRIMELAEEAARKHRCEFMTVDTMSFQAPDFYPRHGFVLWGTLPGYPEGAKRFFFHKPLTYIDQA